MAALRQMPSQVTLLVVALSALCSGAPSPSPSPSASLGHHVLPAVWGGPVVAGFPVAVPLYAGLEGALAAHAHHAFLAAPGALLPGAPLSASYGYGYGYPLNAYAAPAAINIPTASEIYTPHVQAVRTYQAVPVANTVQALPVEYGVPKPAVAAAVTEETPKEAPAPESDKSGDTSQVGGQAVGIDLGSTSGVGSEGETSGSAGGSSGQLGGAEISESGTEAPVTEAAVVEAATEAPVVQTTTPRGAYKLSIAYGVPRGPTLSQNAGNRENFKSSQFDNIESSSNQSGPKIQSLDDLISETFSSTAEADAQRSSLGGSRTGSLDFVDVSGDARTLAASGGLDCTGKGCGTPDAHAFDRTGVPTSSGAFRLSIGNGKKAAVSNEVEDFGQEAVGSQSSAAVPNRAAKQHYYYDLPHLAGVGAAAASGQGGASGAFSGSSSSSASSSSSFASGGFSSAQGNANGDLSGSGPNSFSSSSFASGDSSSGQGSAGGSFSGSGSTSSSSSSFASGGFISPSTSESLPNYPNSVPIPPKPYSAPVLPYPNTTPPPPYPKYGSPVYSAPAYSPPGGRTNGFAPSQPDFVSGSQGGDVGNGVFTPSSGVQAPEAGDEDGVYPPAKPPAPAYGLPQPPPPPAPVDSYGHPIRDLYDIRSGRSISSGQSNKKRSPSNRRRFV